MILQLTILSFIGALSLNEFRRISADKHFNEGNTNDKGKMIKSFDHAYEKYKNKLSIILWFDNKNKDACMFQNVNITKENIRLIKECLISQDWKSILGNTKNGKEVDFNVIKSGGVFKSYQSTFWVDYTAEGSRF